MEFTLKTRITKQFVCSKCVQPLGKQEGVWITYPNPLICLNCQTDNSAAFRHFVLNGLLAEGGEIPEGEEDDVETTVSRDSAAQGVLKPNTTVRL